MSTTTYDACHIPDGPTFHVTDTVFFEQGQFHRTIHITVSLPDKWKQVGLDCSSIDSSIVVHYDGRKVGTKLESSSGGKKT